MAKNPKCQSPNTGECDMDYPDFFKVTSIWAGRKQTRTECLAHAAGSESQGKQVDLIDMR